MTVRLARLGILMCLPLALVSCADSASPSKSSSSSSAGTGGATACPAADGSSAKKAAFDAAPPMCIDPAKTYTATVSTDVGDFEVALDPKKAPKTVNNFVVLARYHFYDGVDFHRVMPSFVVQGGDPQGTGRGGPGYQFADELPEAGAYEVGSLAMANAGPNTNGSQFFVVTGPRGVGLPPLYTLFGKVTSGMDVVQKIEKDGSESGTPTKKHKMTKVTITEK
ncbi:peptidylprolyl isomerase [Austwickia chelonae]|uniref:peptidylprolyl isomerase n=1 Tax=Austwickia chelonae TaxID=100225 RepID=UPI000E252486|nr:peptidylprolyl isomerase [Austwickia chelonae]